MNLQQTFKTNTLENVEILTELNLYASTLHRGSKKNPCLPTQIQYQ